MLYSCSKRSTMLTKSLSVVLLVLVAAAVGFWLGRTTTASAASSSTHFFEFRTYTAAPGKLEALQARFRDNTDRIFQKHELTSVGDFAPPDAPPSKKTVM